MEAAFLQWINPLVPCRKLFMEVLLVILFIICCALTTILIFVGQELSCVNDELRYVKRKLDKCNDLLDEYYGYEDL